MGVGENRLHQEGRVSDGLAASGRSLRSVFWLVFYRSGHWPVVGSPLEPRWVSSSILTALANSLYVKERNQLVNEHFDGRKS